MEHSSDVILSIGPLEITGVVVTMWVIITAGAGELAGNPEHEGCARAAAEPGGNGRE